MNWLIVGAGGVGGFFGALLHSSGETVHFLARGEHFRKICESGLRVESPQQVLTIPPTQFSDSPSGLSPADVLLFCVKSYDTERAAREIAALVTPQTIVISLQNGIGSHTELQRILKLGRSHAGVAYVSAGIASPGVVHETGGPRKIVFGPAEGAHTPADEVVGAAFRKAGIDVTLSDTILTDLWRKFVFITAVGGLTALTRLTIGQLLSTSPSSDLLRAAMMETESLARAKRIPLAPNLVDQFFETLARFTPETTSSLHYDLVHEKPLEIDALSGTVITLGETLSISTPIHRIIYASLLPHHQRHLALRSVP